MRKNIENLILAVTIILCVWSIVMVLSTTINSPNFRILYIKQMVAFLSGLTIMLILRNFSYKILEEISPVLYLISVMMLVGLLFFGVEVHGGRRWFNLGLFYLQPVEFVKLAVILFLASILEKYNRLIYALIPVAIVVVLVIAQPDASSAILFVPVLALMLTVSRVNTKWMGFMLAFGILAVLTLFLESYFSVKSMSLLSLKYMVYPVGGTVIIYLIFREVKTVKKHLNLSYLVWLILLFWISIGTGILGSNLLIGYQKKRIISFMLPELDPLGAGYNIRQSLLAVGSGRFFGKGLFGGTQTQLGFLPVRHTDFIFASVAEELGFLGAVTMLFLLGILLWQMLRIMERTEDSGGRLVAVGIFTLISVQIVLNIGVSLGMLPVIGVQLPFVSYGGTGMVMFMAMIGILLNINRRTEIIGR